MVLRERENGGADWRLGDLRGRAQMGRFCKVSSGGRQAELVRNDSGAYKSGYRSFTSHHCWPAA